MFKSKPYLNKVMATQQNLSLLPESSPCNWSSVTKKKFIFLQPLVLVNKEHGMKS